jgi:hypothetical protein
MRLVLVLLLLNSVANPAVPPGLITFNDDGAWNWFQDERAIAVGGKLIIASIAAGAHDPARAGAVEVAAYDPARGITARFALHQPTTTQERKLWLNDHTCPSLLLRPDGRILAMYSLHGTEPKLYYRISTAPGEIGAWSEERVFIPRPDARITFPNLRALPLENGGAGRLYAFFRGLDRSPMPSWAFSDDVGLTWSAGGVFLRSPVSQGRAAVVPYAKYASDGARAIHVVYSDGHHLDYGNGIYHIFYREGQWFGSDGKPIASLREGLKKPEQGSLVFRAGAKAVAWPHDLHLDAAGRPYLAYSVQENASLKPPDVRGDDHRYHYARWTGSRWVDHEIAYGGSRIHTFMDGDDCTGLVALDPQDPDSLYISTNADPRTGQSLISRADRRRHFEIFHGSTRDLGATWRWMPVTSDSTVDNIRPIVPIWKGDRGAVLWLRGVMRHYIDYDLQVVGILFPRGQPARN